MKLRFGLTLEASVFQRGLSRLMFVLLGALIVWSLPAFAVDVSPTTPQKFATPGEFLTVVFEIENTSGFDDSFNLSLNLPFGWNLISSLVPIALPASETRKVFITVFVPKTTPAQSFTLTLTATSQINPSNTASGNIAIDVRALSAVVIGEPLGQQVLPGTDVEYVFTVENRGNVPDIFSIGVRSSRAFNVRATPIQVGLLPGNSDTVTVVVEVPQQTESGVDQLTFTATSSSAPEVQATAIVLTQILPPTASGIGGSLLLTLPASLRMLLVKDLINNRDTLGSSLNTGGALGDIRLDIDANISDLLSDITIDTLQIGIQAVPDDGFSFSVSHTPSSTNITGIARFDLGSISVSYFTSEFTPFTIENPTQTPSVVVGQTRLISNFSISALVGTPVGLSLSGNMMLSDLFGSVGRSGRADLSYRLEDFQAKAGFFLTGPRFSGGGLDREGFQVAAGFASPPYIIFPSLEFSNNNVDETLQTTSHKSSGRVLLGLGLPELPVITLDLSTEKTQTASNNFGLGPVINGPPRIVERRVLTIAYSIGPNSFVLSQRHEEVIEFDTNNPGNPDIFTTDGTALSLRFAMFSPFIISFSMDDAVTKNELNQIIDSTFNRQLGISVQGRTFGSSLTFTLDDKRTLFSTSLSANPSEDLQLSLGLNVSFLTLGPANPAMSLVFGIDNRFALPIPFAIKGRLEGIVFVDENNNGQLDGNDTLLPSLIVNASGKRVSTNAQGFYRTPPLDPGVQRVTLENLPAEFAPTIGLPLQVSVQAGQTLKLNIPLKRVAFVTGLVFNDANRNGTQDQGEGGIPNVRVQLSGQGLIRQTSTNANGRLGFADLPPGDYRLVVDLSSLPARFELTTPTEINIAVVSGGGANALWGAAERPRQIVVTFRPPQAAFSFSPTNPVAGQLVTFDSSSSEDPDGFIQLYEWDFDNDGKTDATGFEVEHIFAMAGTFEVKLTVTDNDGNEGSTIQTVTVTP